MVNAYTSITVLPSAARTASVDSASFTGYKAKYADIIIDATAAADTPSVVFTVQGYAPISGKWYTILASAAITGTGTTVLRIGPGIAASANVAANAMLPMTWRVSAVAGDSDSLTYSVEANISD